MEATELLDAAIHHSISPALTSVLFAVCNKTGEQQAISMSRLGLLNLTSCPAPSWHQGLFAPKFLQPKIPAFHTSVLQLHAYFWLFPQCCNCCPRDLIAQFSKPCTEDRSASLTTIYPSTGTKGEEGSKKVCFRWLWLIWVLK